MDNINFQLQSLILCPEIYMTLMILIIIIFGLFFNNTIINNILITTKLKNEFNINIQLFNIFGIQILFFTLILINNSIILNINTTTNQYLFDNTNYFVTIILLISASFFLYQIIPLFKIDYRYTFEYIILILTSLIGMLLLIKANDLIAMYLAIELQSMSFYILAAFGKTSKYGTEAGLKYYVMGGLTSSIQLLGIALIYGTIGLTNYNDLKHFINISNITHDNFNQLINEPYTTALITGFLLIFSGLVFKIGAVPFHKWLPDVYQGSPLASTAFFSIVPKISIIIAIYRLNTLTNSIEFNQLHSLQYFFYFISIFSIIIGSIQGLHQKNLKRLFAYSSISHIGFILLATVTGFWSASIFYILIYIIMIIGIFSLIIEFKNFSLINNQYYELLWFKNLGEKQPIMVWTFAIILFSFAGIPPLIGFFSKFYILENAINHGFIIWSIIAILASVIATIYYIKIIQFMYFQTYIPSISKSILIIKNNSNKTALIASLSVTLILTLFFNQEILFDIINEYILI